MKINTNKIPLFLLSLLTNKRIFLFLFFAYSFTNLYAQVTPPTIQACGTDQTFCLTENEFELCVKIEVTLGLPAPIDHFEITWGDETAITTVSGSDNPPNQNHLYDLDLFYNTCDYEQEYFVELETFLTNGQMLNSSFKVTFLNPPSAGFDINPEVICAGNEACFIDSSCPLEGLSIISWNYGDGESGLENCHVYDAVGSYPITLTVENFCGTDTATESLEVIPPPEANAVATSGVVDLNADTLVVCLGGGGGLVDLNGDSLSMNENEYLWTALTNTSNYNWDVDPNSPNNPIISDPAIGFLNSGIYSVVLRVDNACNQPSFDTLIFNVIAAVALSINPQPDACLTLEYSPNPLNPDATYTINGIPENNFPSTLGIGEYIVECFLENECGPQTVNDEFSVNDLINATILSPNDTILCPDSAPILLQASPEEGTWTGSINIDTNTEGDSTWYYPSPGEVATLTYSPSSTSSINCGNPASITISVESGGVISDDYLICDWTENFQLEASPTPDSWSSTDCPSCIVNDSFIVSEMVAQGLSSVIVMFEATSNSSSACQSSGMLTVDLQNPLASFIMDSTGCSNFPIPADAFASIANQPLVWMVDGVLNPGGPPFALDAGTHTVQLIATYGECSDTTEQSITVIDPPPVLNFTVDTLEGCADLEIEMEVVGAEIPGVSYNWYLDGVLFSSDYNPGNLILGQGLTDTTYTISLGTGNNCGDETASQEITVYPKPIVNFGTNLLEYCSGDTIFLGNASHGNPISYFWNFGNGTTSTEENPPYVILFTGDTPTTYPITLIGFNDCGTDTITKFIPINPTDVNAFFNTSSTSACVGDTICFESFSTFGAGIIFDFGDGTTTTALAPCHVYADTGTYEVSLKVFGCGFDSIFTTVEILPLPLVNIEVENSIYCPNALISFSATAGNIVDYFWDFGNNNTTTVSNPEFSYDTPGTYQVKLTGMSIDSCVSQDSMLITIADFPQAQFALSNDTICEGSAVQFVNTSIGGTSCFWDFGDGNFSTDCVPDHTYANAGSYAVELVMTSSNGCQDVFSQLVVVVAEPNPNFTYILNQSCTPVTATFTNLSSDAQSYEWTFGNGDTSTETNPTVVYNTGGVFSVELIATNVFCSRPTVDTVSIIQTPIPLVGLNGAAPEGCAPTTINFSAVVQAQDDLDYVWDFDDGTFSFNANENHPYTVPGVYNVKLLVFTQTDSICKDSVMQTITIHEPVLIDDAITDILCYGDSTGAIDITTISGTVPYEFDWSNGTVLEDANTLIAGQYELLITDSLGCTLMDTFQITQASLIIPATQDSSIVTCFGGDDGAICIEVSGGVADYNINWDSGVIGNCLDNVVAGNYAVSVTDANNCLIESIFEVYENPAIVVKDSVANVSCFGEEDGFILLDSITGGVSSFYNNTLTGPVSFEEGDFFTDLLPGEYQLVVQDLEGCIYEADYTIGEPDSLWLNIIADSLLLDMGDSIRIDVAHNADQPFFAWQLVTGLDCYDCESPWAMPLQTTVYNLDLIDENGCTAEDKTTVVVDPNRNFYIPNTFTPNGDRRNDLFRIRSRIASIQQVNVFRIFDRWGELVFEATDFRPQDENEEDAWDGTFRGKELTTETFAYYLEVLYLDGVKESVEGTVTLVR